ncbi:NAD(P)/FAD-dependent oxidoreductase [Winogradskyella arenosi]|uniref:Glycine/D-amino acid oxidase-like deaminating enzyme n=1 Tax=Winogradskyella arenosi TaxID=533325 RepID=A0A368ZIP5_9FLAO|nr:FAD-binding oxidoreductase [Winogradskyella arenosi]RCW93659.1 glycine/D-amino acid oxidase-like deaminating enzyme [Winogradskyella arenosi]
MNLSYWEIKTWLSNIDFTIVGSGIVGLNCALRLKEKFPKAKILILEKGMLPQGASTKNAGFACFGSLSEIIDDLKDHTEEETLNLVTQRINGLKRLRETLGDRRIAYKNGGGYELFLKTDTELYDSCLEQHRAINTLLQPLFRAPVFQWKATSVGFNQVQPKYSFNAFEGQIDTGKMMEALVLKVRAIGIKILNNCTVESYEDLINSVEIRTNHFSFSTKNLFIATNGFSKAFNLTEVLPARAQVLITEPITNLHFKGTFHLDKGYYYFRNIDRRVLLGGGRHLDFKTEETTEFGETALIQGQLEQVLKTTILPNTDFKIDHRWSGIMGVGKQKKALVKQLSNHVFCGVRLGGMGIAIGSTIGKELADLLE